MSTVGKQNQPAKERKGLSFSKFSYILGVIVIILSVSLLVTTFFVNEEYEDVQKASENHIRWQQIAWNLEQASDYLTNEVRLFVETGKDEHLQNYFWEANVSKRRDTALEEIQKDFSEESQVYRFLNSAMNESLDLMRREYLAMRLKLESMHKEISLYPQEIQDIEVGEETLALPSDQLAQLARRYVLDDYYSEKKDRIEQRVNGCLDGLLQEATATQNRLSFNMRLVLAVQRTEILALVLSLMVFAFFTVRQVIRPLRTAVPKIKKNETLDELGSQEFRLFAKAYNGLRASNLSYREKLEFKANHDPLTGVLNRYGLDAILDRSELGNAAVLVVDVDNFKQFNDTYGHDVGDKILALVAQTIRVSFRSNDVVCRMGGDEFAVLMWNVGPEQKELIASKIDSCNQTLQHGAGDLPPISISVGVAFGMGYKPRDVFHHADVALYLVKGRGGAGCAFFDE